MSNDHEPAAAAAFDLYSSARRRLTLFQTLNRRPPWPERPAELPEDFDESHMTVLRDDLRTKWALAYPAPTWSGDDETAEPPAEGFERIGATHDIEGMIAYIDQRYET